MIYDHASPNSFLVPFYFDCLLGVTRLNSLYMNTFCGLKKSKAPQKELAMEARYTLRNHQWLAACQVAPELFEQVIPRLHTCMEPCVDSFQGHARSHHAKPDVSGLLSDVERKHVASLASHGGQNRLGLPGCIGWADGDDAPWRKTWRDQVGTPVGPGEGVWGCDPAAFPKSGRASVGVARQWGGRLGNVGPCAVALSLGDVSRKGHTLVDRRLYLPTAWTPEKARLQTAGVPNARRGYRTRHPWAWERLAHTGAARPQAWRAVPRPLRLDTSTSGCVRTRR